MRTPFSHTLLLGLAMAFGLALAAPAGHARADSGEGAIRISVDVPVLTLRQFPGAPRLGGVLPQSRVAVQFGLWGQNQFIPQVGASFAYQLTDAWVLGARLGFGVWSLNYNVTIAGRARAVTTEGLFSLLPFAEYMFLSGDLRPFVGGRAGFQALFPNAGNAWGTFVGGAMGGVHWFLEKSFSISPTLFVDVLYSGQMQRAGYDIILAVSFDGWMGGASSPTPAPEPRPAPATNQPPPPANPPPPPPPPAQEANPEQGIY